MKSAIACALVGTLCFPPFATVASDVDISHDYGVFLGATPADIDYMKNYDTIVIDAQYFTEDQIAQLKEGGHTVFSYLNIGSVENFRPYYSEYEDLTFADYDNWPEERWVDVSEDDWQEFILEDLTPSILEKGVDGLFVDNVDVYYVASEEGLYDGDDEDIYYGVENILESLAAMDTYVCINGGDTFVWEYFDRDGDLMDIMDAVNQESVFSSIEYYEDDIFGEADDENHEWYTEYIEMCADECIDVYLLEYTTDADLIAQIDAYCREMEFAYYASPSVKLLAEENTVETVTVAEPVNETEIAEPVEESALETDEEAEVEDVPSYGVFLGAQSDVHHLTAEDIEYMRSFDIIVIDAQYYTADEIAALKEGGHTVYSYINVGSLERFRDYYDDYSDLTFADYDNWNEEWVDVSSGRWYDFIVEEVGASILAAGCDGFFVDNVDVYYIALNEDDEFEFYEGHNVDAGRIFNGLENILIGLQQLPGEPYVCINGGDTFVTAYAESGRPLSNIMDACNQESVFSSIVWGEEIDPDTGDNVVLGFREATPNDHEAYMEYCELVEEQGLDVYLLEYTDNAEVLSDIDGYCGEHGFSYFATSDVQLRAISDPMDENVYVPVDTDAEVEDVTAEVFDDEDDVEVEDVTSEVFDDDDVIELDPADDNDEPVEVVVDDADIAELEELDGLQDYGVFLGASPDNIEYMRGYRTIVIDAQNFSAEQIAELKAGGRTVLSYINVGSIERTRSYYSRFQDLGFADYNNWNEDWVDVSSERWQRFMLDEVATEILNKGCDGFFVDNVDVYYVARNEDNEFEFYQGHNVDPDAIFDGLTQILTGLQNLPGNPYVCINGGDTYVTEYAESGNIHDIMDAVNQESVFSSIIWSDEEDPETGDNLVLGFEREPDEEHNYYVAYCTLVGRAGCDVYLLEYTDDPSVVTDISGYCERNNYTYYATNNVQLEAGSN